MINLSNRKIANIIEYTINENEVAKDSEYIKNELGKALNILYSLEDKTNYSIKRLGTIINKLQILTTLI